MVLFGDTQGTLAEAIGMTPPRLSSKITEWNGAEFTQSEIKIIKERYNLTNDEVDAIFFADDVSSEDTSEV
jgi:hypothetical protein